MLVSQEVMDALKAIGLNLYERKLWVALLSRGVSTAGELAEISGVPRSRAYDILESLAEKGFVLIKPSKPMQYVAIEPKDAFERAKLKIMEKAEEMAKRLDKVRKSEVGKELERIYKEGLQVINPEDMMSAIKGRHLMHQQLGSMLKKARKHVKIVAPAKTVKELAMTHGNKLARLAKKGVQVDILTSVDGRDEVLEDLARQLNIRNLKGLEEVERLTGGFVVVDGKEALLSITPDDVHASQHSSVWLNSEHVARNVLHPTFSALWEKARPLGKK